MLLTSRPILDTDKICQLPFIIYSFSRRLNAAVTFALDLNSAETVRPACVTASSVVYCVMSSSL